MAKKTVAKKATKKVTKTAPVAKKKEFVMPERKIIPQSTGDKWIIKYQSKVAYEKLTNGWKVVDKKTNTIIAKGDTLDACFTNASKQEGWKL